MFWNRYCRTHCFPLALNLWGFSYLLEGFATVPCTGYQVNISKCEIVQSYHIWSSDQTLFTIRTNLGPSYYKLRFPRRHFPTFLTGMDTRSFWIATRSKFNLNDCFPLRHQVCARYSPIVIYISTQFKCYESLNINIKHGTTRLLSPSESSYRYSS